MAKQPEQKPNIAQQIETAMQRAAELQREHEKALVAGEQTAAILARHAAAIEQARALKAQLVTEQKAAEQAAAAAELAELEPRIAAEIASTLKPLEARAAQGFAVAVPGMPRVNEEHLVSALRKRDELADAERQLQDCKVRGETLRARIETLQSERTSLIARRAAGEQRQDDATQLSLMDADLIALNGLLESAETQYRTLKTKRDASQRDSTTVDGYWADEQKRVMAEFYESVAMRVESLLAECFEQQTRNTRNSISYDHKPAFYDARVRAVAGLMPIGAVVAKSEPQPVTVRCTNCKWIGARTDLFKTALGEVCPKCLQRGFSAVAPRELAA